MLKKHNIKFERHFSIILVYNIWKSFHFPEERYIKRSEKTKNSNNKKVLIHTVTVGEGVGWGKWGHTSQNHPIIEGQPKRCIEADVAAPHTILQFLFLLFHFFPFKEKKCYFNN
ncbi:hypothetical protein Csa_009635 [Cucumis sativus]|nr:hypothetical protein Csa_009635 [Cucumis sativus]